MRIVLAVAAALSHAHREGVVHRDIKPENILLAGDAGGGPAMPLVADFGIAGALDAAAGERLTASGLALGTPAYMSPEQGSGSALLDARSDIYALGCVAYEMLAGAPPFTGPTARAMMARHAADPVPPLHTVRPSVPEAVVRAIERALAKVPADRFATADEFAHALAAGPSPAARGGRHTGMRWKEFVSVLALAGTVAAGTTWLRRPPLPAAIPSAARIAVLPFLSPAGDTALVRLGKDLASTISASLEGVDGIETADRLAIATSTSGADLTPAVGAALARRLGASSVVRGTLVRAGDRIRLDLGIYGLDGRALTDGIAVTAHHDSIGAITDSASWSLLRNVWRRGEPPSPSFQAITTRSLPALRAFLDGERELAANHWEEALLAFSSAVAADSSFWLAQFHQALSLYWLGQAFEFDVEPLRRHLHLLPERERLLIRSMIDSVPLAARIEGLRSLTQRFPHYWPGWFMYGDVLYHYAPSLGHDRTESVEAFQRVVALNPRLIPGWEHLLGQLTWAGHPDTSHVLARLTEVGWTGHQDQFFRLRAGVTGAGGVILHDMGDLADSLAELMATAPKTYRPRGYGAPGLYLLEAGFPAAQIELNARALGFGARGIPEVRTELRAASAWSWAARGRWDSAIALMAGVAAERPGVIGRPRALSPQYPPVGGPVPAIETYAIAVVAAWLGATSPDRAAQHRAAALAAIDGLEEDESRRDARARLAWFDGILGYRGRDGAAIAAARSEARRSGYRHAVLVDGSLAAFGRALTGERARPGRELAALDFQCINATQAHSFLSEANSCNSFTPHIAIQRLAAAQWLHEAGEHEQAARLLRYQDAAIWGGWLWSFNYALAGPTYLARARLEEGRGDHDRARQFYREFLRLYDRPMRSHAHLVEEARGALARQSGEPGPGPAP